jgi:hypothetical protein
MGIRSIKDYQLVRVTAAGQEYAAFSQTEVRELFRIAQLREFEPAGIHKPKAKSNVLGLSIVDSTHTAGLELRG